MYSTLLGRSGKLESLDTTKKITVLWAKWQISGICGSKLSVRGATEVTDNDNTSKLDKTSTPLHRNSSPSFQVMPCPDGPPLKKARVWPNWLHTVPWRGVRPEGTMVCFFFGSRTDKINVTRTRVSRYKVNPPLFPVSSFSLSLHPKTLY